MDVEAIIARAPQVALVDELAHTNADGCRHAKRYEDVLEILERGINVITTINVQHLESVAARVEEATGIAVRERIPDAVLRRAEQYLLLDGQDMTAVMDRLNELAAQREKEMDALKAEQQRTREKRKAVQERFERERERLIAEVREVSATIMKDWQEGRAGHKQALKQLAKVRADLNVQPDQEENAAPVFDIADLKPGQTVLHRPWNKKAVVREVDVRQSRVKLDMNGVTLWADAGLLGGL